MVNRDEPQSLPLDHEPLNRKERRDRRFRRTGTPPTSGAATPDRANPAAGRGGDDQRAYAGTPDGNVTRLTGAGTGGATESDDRVSEHEGMHRPSRPNG